MESHLGESLAVAASLRPLDSRPVASTSLRRHSHAGSQQLKSIHSRDSRNSASRAVTTSCGEGIRGCGQRPPSIAATANVESGLANALPCLSLQIRARWAPAQVLRDSQRSPFEKAAWPRRVPLLAFDSVGLRLEEVRWLLSVLIDLDSAFLSPVVLRITFPTQASCCMLADSVRGGLAAAGAAAGAGREASEARAGGIGAAGEAASVVAVARPMGEDDGGWAPAPRPGDGKSGSRAGCPGVQTPQTKDRVAAAVVAEQVQARQCQLTETAGLRRTDLEVMTSPRVAVGSDGPHMYLVPTGVTLERTW